MVKRNADTDRNITGFAQLTMVDGRVGFTPLFGNGSFMVGDLVTLFSASGAVIQPIGSVPVFPMVSAPNTPPLTSYIGTVPVYASTSGVEQRPSLLSVMLDGLGKIYSPTASGLDVAVFKNVNPPLFLTQASVPETPKQSITPVAGSTPPPRLSNTPTSVSVTPAANRPTYVIVTSDGFLRLVNGVPSGVPVGKLDTYVNNTATGYVVPIFNQ